MRARVAESGLGLGVLGLLVWSAAAALFGVLLASLASIERVPAAVAGSLVVET